MILDLSVMSSTPIYGRQPVYMTLLNPLLLLSSRPVTALNLPSSKPFPLVWGFPRKR